MNNTIKSIAVCILPALLVLLYTEVTIAQSGDTERGRITGIVVDGSSGQPLIGATVVLTGTTSGVSTNLDGEFILPRLTPGMYSVTISYVSYETLIINEIEVGVNDVVRLDIVLKENGTELSELVISAGRVQNTDASMLRHRQKSIAFADAISAEGISRSGAGDAADAMKKVTGATVIGGKYVYVRGLGDRYTNTQLNGLELPTSNPDKKAFQLDLFPSHLLDNIVTLKTFTPDKPGNFSGGLIDVTTKGIPDRLYVTLSLKNGYNTESSMNSLLLGEKGDLDWFGMENGLRSEPSLLLNRPTNSYPSATQARLNPELASELDSYSLSNSYYTNGRNGRFELLGQFEESEVLNQNIDLSDTRGSQTVDWGLLGSVGLIIGNNNKLNYSYLQTQSGENTGRYLFGFWEQFNSEDIEFRSRVNQFIDRDLATHQLSGSHSFSFLNNAKFEWNTGIQSNGQEQPDFRVIASEARYIRDASGAVADTLLGNPNSQFPRPARLFRDLNETKKTATADITVPISLGNRSLTYKMGALYENTERDFRERRYDYQQGRNFSLNQFKTEAEYLNSLGVLGYDNANRAQIGNYVVSATSDRSSYDASQDIRAAYAMFDVNITRFLNLATGLRYESTELRSTSRDSTLLDTDRFARVSKDDLLPSVNLRMSISDNSSFRASYSRTLARPTFREMSPYVSFDFVGDNLFRGNGTLERTLIRNYDLRWEWYPSSLEMISASVFYKQLDNPIERVLRFDISEKAESIQNVDEGVVFGAEFEIRKNLGFVFEALKNVEIIANYAWIQSEVTIPEAELVLMRQTQVNPPEKRPLTGQSPYVVNLDLAWYNPRHAFSTNISFNRFGDRLSRVAQGSTPNVYERAYNTLNANVSKSFGRNISVSLSASNILNPKVTYSQRFKGNEYLYQQYKTGTTFSFGVKYSL
ncbi:MAG: TonB-dependent receptor [Rhodothermaceae bacterium]|nr:TonB-dependent receptor [Rhodothermaceae bacterium]